MDSQENILEQGISEEKVNQEAAPEVVTTAEVQEPQEAQEPEEAQAPEEVAPKVYETKKEVLDRVKEIAHGEDMPQKEEVDYLKTVFYKLHIAEREANLKEYLPGFPDIESFKGALAEKLAAGDAQVVLSEEQLAEIRKEADGKFRTWEWNVGRSPKADFHCGKKFSCGTVEASWTVKDGIVETLSFGGDFIGNLPADGLAKKIAGSRFDRACIEDLLSGLPVSDYFDGLAPGELAGLFF